MRRRLYFTFPDVAHTQRAVNELLLARIDIGHIHVLAKEGIDLGDLPEANILQKSDLVYGFGRGMMIGGLTGALVGTVAGWVMASGIAGGLILVCALAGALIGSWAAAMISSDVRNSRLERFDQAIAEGQILLMVDAPKEQVQDITDLVVQHHPEAQNKGVEPTIPAFP